MHEEAIRCAIAEYGPRLTNVNGAWDTQRAAYYLTKKELDKLFTKNGFNTNGVPWLKMILKFGETWGENLPSQSTVMDRNFDSWQIVFVNLPESDLTRLKMFAENHNVLAFPRVE